MEMTPYSLETFPRVGVWSCQLRGGWVQCRKRKREPLARKALWKTNTVIASEADIAPNSLYREIR